MLGAGVLGWALGRRIPALGKAGGHGGEDGPEPLISDGALHHALPSRRRSGAVLTTGLVLWSAPIVAFALLSGATDTDVFVDQGLFFSGAAVVTFGGAYAVLAYVAQQAVSVYGWLAPGEMVRCSRPCS